MEYNYVYVDLANGSKGRVHLSHFDLVDDDSNFLGVRSSTMEVGQ